MKALFVLTPEARADLKSILLEIAEDSPDAAGRLRIKFHEGIQSLGQSSDIGHYHDEPPNRKCRYRNFYRYVVAYVREATPIQVIYMIHGARNLNAFFALRGGIDS